MSTIVALKVQGETDPNVLLQSLEFCVQASLLRTFSDPLFKLLQLGLLTNLIADLHVFPFSIKLELAANTLFRSTLEATVWRSRTRCVRVGLDFSGNNGNWHWWGCRGVAGIGLEKGLSDTR